MKSESSWYNFLNTKTKYFRIKKTIVFISLRRIVLFWYRTQSELPEPGEVVEDREDNDGGQVAGDRSPGVSHLTTIFPRNWCGPCQNCKSILLPWSRDGRRWRTSPLLWPVSSILILKHFMREKRGRRGIPVRPTLARGKMRGMRKLYSTCFSRLKLIIKKWRLKLILCGCVVSGTELSTPDLYIVRSFFL